MGIPFFVGSLLLFTKVAAFLPAQEMFRFDDTQLTILVDVESIKDFTRKFPSLRF
jgi:hypothetical protein